MTPQVDMQRARRPQAGRSIVVGLGRTGMSCVRYLHARGIEFAVTDSRAAPPEAATLRDQIEEAIDEAEDEPIKRGDLSTVERQMLRNLLHFGDRTVGEIAVTRGDIVSVSSTVSFDGLIAAFADAEHSRLPVTGEDLDEVVGMIHIKDVFKAQVDPARPSVLRGIILPCFATHV